MSACALPLHLRNKRHTDYVWPLSYIPRSFNAKGPRCEKGSSGYLSWPPRLIEGYGVSRWENSRATSVIEIPEFANCHITPAIYGRTYAAIEKNPGNPNFGKYFEVTLNWSELKVLSETIQLDGEPPTFVEKLVLYGPDLYSPSALQQFSQKGFLEMAPDYYHNWKKLTDTKTYCFRHGWRPDHLDLYYNFGPYLGLNFE